MPDLVSASPPADKPAAKRSLAKLYLVIAVCAAPVIASYVVYYFVRPETRTNYGVLVDPQRPMPSLPLRTLDGAPVDSLSLRGKWLMVMVAGGACPGDCPDRLYHLRQVRLTTGKDRERVLRVWLVPDAAPVARRWLDEYDGTQILHVDPAALTDWFGTEADFADRIHVIDPLGNLMMRFPAKADPNRIKRDLAKLLRASRVG